MPQNCETMHKVACAFPHVALRQLPYIAKPPSCARLLPRPQNCEMRTVVLSDGGGAGVPDRTWFRGGEAYAEPQKGMLPDVKHQGKGSLLQALQMAWEGRRSGGGKR